MKCSRIAALTLAIAVSVVAVVVSAIPASIRADRGESDPSQARSGIQSLPREILQRIHAELRPHDLLHLGETSSAFAEHVYALRQHHLDRRFDRGRRSRSAAWYLEHIQEQRRYPEEIRLSEQDVIGNLEDLQNLDHALGWPGSRAKLAISLFAQPEEWPPTLTVLLQDQLLRVSASPDEGLKELAFPSQGSLSPHQLELMRSLKHLDALTIQSWTNVWNPEGILYLRYLEQHAEKKKRGMSDLAFGPSLDDPE